MPLARPKDSCEFVSCEMLTDTFFANDCLLMLQQRYCLGLSEYD